MSEEVCLCPRCGGAAIDVPALPESPAVCATCGWQGQAYELVAVPVKTAETDEQRLDNLFQVFAKALVEGATIGIARVLMGWGFLAPQVHDDGQVSFDPKVLNQYMFAIAKAGLIAVLKKAQEMSDSQHVGAANDG